MRNKKTLLSICGLVACGLITIPSITSCSSVEQKILDNLVDKGDSLNFSDTLSLEDQVKNSLSSSSGYNAYKKKLVDDILFNWYKSKIDENNLGASPASFKKNWEKWDDDAKKNYDDKVKSYKDSHKNNWQYYFQNEVLDPVGGTKDSFIRDQICASVRSAFTDLIFQNDVLRIPSNWNEDISYDERNATLNSPSEETVKNTKSWEKMNFFSSVDSSFDLYPALANQYAIIQKTTFEKYIHDVRPISTAMCLWKYSAPNGGMNSVYNADKIPSANDGEDQGIKESFEYPSFKQPSGPLTPEKTANDKYFSFTNRWKTNNFIGTNGEISIPTEFTDDSATLMITEGEKAFSSLDVSFAGVVSDLWNGYALNSASHLNNDYLNAVLNIPTEIQGTDILKNFLFANGSPESATVKSSKYAIDLSEIYEFNGEAKDQADDKFSSLLFNQITSPYAKSDTKQGIRYAVPAVRLKKDATTTLPYVLIRDSFGVHLIGLDCASYINTYATGTKTIWDAEANVLKYRSTSETLGYSKQGSGMNLSSKLKDYFTNNIDSIILDLTSEQTLAHIEKTGDQTAPIFSNKIWGENIFQAVSDLNNAADAFSTYYSVISSLDEANKKLFGFSQKFIKNNLLRKSGNITNTVYLNGLANALPFEIKSGNSSSVDFLDSSKLYDFTDTYTASKLVYGFDSSYLNKFSSILNVSDPTLLTKSNLDSLYTNLKSKLSQLWTAAAYKPNTSKEETLNYSEHIVIQRNGGIDADENASDAINFALNAFGGGADFSNYIKYDAYNKYIGEWSNKYENDFGSPLTSIYKTNKILSDSTPITYFNNGAKISDSSTFEKTVKNGWKSNAVRLNSDNQLFSNSNLDYGLTLATLYYLTKNNYENLIQHLRGVIDLNASAFVAWSEKDLTEIGFNEKFSNISKTAEQYSDIFGWNENYSGLLDKIYQSTNFTGDDSIDSGFIDYSNYYHYADMPFTNSDGSVSALKKAMGFVGLQTSNSSRDLDDNVSDVLFNKNNKHLFNSVANAVTDSLAPNGEGSLYRYGSLENLKQAIQLSNGIDELKGYASSIQQSIPTNYEFDHIVSQIKNDKIDDGTKLKTAEDYRKLILIAFDETKPLITADMFKGFNYLNNNLGGAQLKSNNEIDGAAIPIGVGSTRTYVVQLNSYDLDESIGDYSAITNHLIKLFGGTNATAGDVGFNVLNTIAVQYALKSEVQSKATTDLINVVFEGHKIKVYDRRINDQLGQSWIKDWKRTN